MPLQGLTIIGESINDSVPSTHALFAANDLAGIMNLAKSQADLGAARQGRIVAQRFQPLPRATLRILLDR